MKYIIKRNYITPSFKTVAVVTRALVCDVSGGNEDIIIDEESGNLGDMDD